MVTLDEYRFRFLGHDGAVDNSFHHSGATCEDVVGVSKQVEGAQRYQKAISKIAQTISHSPFSGISGECT